MEKKKGSTNHSNGNHDKILRVLETKTNKWRGEYFDLQTSTRITPKPREMHTQAGVLTYNWQEFTITDGFLDHVDISPEETFNTVWVESRVGNDEGTGLAIVTEAAEEGNPLRILKESLEQRLKRMYKEARTNSFESFISGFSQSNSYKTREHLERLRTTRERKPISLFYNLEKSEVVEDIQDATPLSIPGPTIQGLLKNISETLAGNNRITEGGFRTHASIAIINESERYANSEGSVIRTNFSGYYIKYKIKFRNPVSGETSVDWTFGTTKRDIRRQKKFLLKKAEELNKLYNEFFNNSDAVSIPQGRWVAFMDAATASTEIHEAIVHSCSSPSLVKHLQYPDDEEERAENPFAIQDIGTRVANPNLTIFSNPKKKYGDGRLCWGGFQYDHEGVPAKRTPIIKNGVLVGLLADRNDSYLLNHILGSGTIKPGASRFGVNDAKEIDAQEPRTGVIEASWNEKITERQLWDRFLRRIKSQGRPMEDPNGKPGKAGLWFKSGMHGEYTEEGTAKVYFCPAYLVFGDGTYYPVRDMVYTSNSPRAILDNTLGISTPKTKEELSGKCGTGEDGEYLVRESLFVGPTLMKDCEVRIVTDMLRR